jgi:hypothetical protein
MLSQQDRDCCETWGLPQGEADDFAMDLMRRVDAVCSAVHALLPEGSRDLRLSHQMSANVGADEQLRLGVSAFWWPTGAGGDDVLDVGYSVSWPREPNGDITILFGADVTDWGFLFPPVEQDVPCASAASRITTLAPSVEILGRSLAGRERDLADALVKLQRNGGRWPEGS